MTDNAKALSLDEMSNLVRHSFYEHCKEMAEATLAASGATLLNEGSIVAVNPYWIVDVYPTYLVCAKDGLEYYRVDFTMSADGIMFAEADKWLTVEKEWVEANYVSDQKGVFTKRLVGYGSEVKALGNGKVGGYLVLFGEPDTADFVNDFFRKSTDFGVSFDEKPEGTIRYHHKFDPVIGGRGLGKATIGSDDVGIWIEGQLNLKDSYDEAVYKLIKKRKLGWSSAAKNDVQRELEGKAYFIKRWPLDLEDFTLTPTPADYRQIADMKSVSASNITELINSMDVTADEPEAQSSPETGNPPVASVVSPPDAIPTEIKSVADEAAFLLPPNENNGDNIMTDVQIAPPVDNSAEVATLKSDFAALKGQLDIILKAPAQPNPVEVKATVDADKEAEAAEMKAFEAYARTGERNNKHLKAALNEGTAGQGGYLVPVRYSNEMVTARRYLSILRAAGAKVIKVDGTNSFKVPTMTDSAAAVLTAEAAAFDQKEPTFGEVTFVPYKYTKLVKASDESVADSRIPIMDIVTQDANQAFAAAENAAFTTGTGSSQPQGVVTGASAGVTAAGTAVITADEVIDLYHSLADLYRQNAVWMMNDATLKLIRKLKDTTNQYLWSPGLASGEPSTILGRPVYINNSMAAPATGVKSVLFGDLSYFWIADFAGMEMKRLNELYAGNGQVGFTWFNRIDSHVMLSAALKVLTQA